jgi:hypothetical protein
MKVDFFEEFPTEENLEKAVLIKQPALVYVAAHSLGEFEAAALRLCSVNPSLRIGYWPVLKESYWISPFSYTRELRGLKEELENRDSELDVLLDLELPLLKPSLFLRNILSFFRNRSVIHELFLLAKDSHIRFSTAEYPTATGIGCIFLKLLGVSYSVKRYGHQRILMFYSSMAKKVLPPFDIDLRKWFRNRLKREIKKDSSIVLGLGTISVGIFGNEPILSPIELQSDLEYCTRLGLDRVVIFRMGGLSEEYASVIARFTS